MFEVNEAFAPVSDGVAEGTRPDEKKLNRTAARSRSATHSEDPVPASRRRCCITCGTGNRYGLQTMRGVGPGQRHDPRTALMSGSAIRRTGGTTWTCPRHHHQQTRSAKCRQRCGEHRRGRRRATGAGRPGDPDRRAHRIGSFIILCRCGLEGNRSAGEPLHAQRPE